MDFEIFFPNSVEDLSTWRTSLREQEDMESAWSLRYDRSHATHISVSVYIDFRTIASFVGVLLKVLGNRIRHL